jgi:hypothetical protein
MMPAETSRRFGAPMPDEYAIAAARRRRQTARDRALLRARTGLSSVRPRSTIYGASGRRWWLRLLRRRGRG